MKLLFVNACGSREGDINHALLILENLPPEIEVVVATMPRGMVSEALRALPNVLSLLTIEMGGSEMPPSTRRFGVVSEIVDFFSALRRIAAYARRERVDLICSIDRTVSAYLTALASLFSRLPFMLIAAYPFYGQGGFLNRYVLRRAKRIVSHSDYLTSHLQAYVRDPAQIATIHDPIDTRLYRPDPAACAAQRAAWSVPAGAAIVLLAGRVNKYKGHDDLVRAAQRVLQKRPEVQFLFCGRADPQPINLQGRTDSFKGHVESLIQELGVGNNVRFLGFVPDLVVAMGAADIVTMPSHEEPYGLVALEAMALGKPVVATRAGGVPEFVRDGETGLLVPPRDPDALAAALLRLIDDPEAARAMGRRGQERAVSELDIADYMSLFVPVLHAMVGLQTTDTGTAGHDMLREQTDNLQTCQADVSNDTRM